MKVYGVSIKDGNDISHNWTVSASSKYKALCAILESFNDESYGMPYSIQKDGIKSVYVYEIDTTYKVFG